MAIFDPTPAPDNVASGTCCPKHVESLTECHVAPREATKHTHAACAFGARIVSGNAAWGFILGVHSVCVFFEFLLGDRYGSAVWESVVEVLSGSPV